MGWQVSFVYVSLFCVAMMFVLIIEKELVKCICFCTLHVSYVLVTCSHWSVSKVNAENLDVEMMLKDNTKMSNLPERNANKRLLPQLKHKISCVHRYGSHGFEMINVTYSGDQLIAYKVTGDQNIPRGEISFTADLSPDSHMEEQGLDPIVLSEGSAKKWGTKR